MEFYFNHFWQTMQFDSTKLFGYHIKSEKKGEDPNNHPQLVLYIT